MVGTSVDSGTRAGVGIAVTIADGVGVDGGSGVGIAVDNSPTWTVSAMDGVPSAFMANRKYDPGRLMFGFPSTSRENEPSLLLIEDKGMRRMSLLTAWVEADNLTNANVCGALVSIRTENSTARSITVGADWRMGRSLGSPKASSR